MEMSIINIYILYVVGCKKNSSPMSHTKFRRQLTIALVGDFQLGGGVIIPHPGGKHQDCTVCSKRNVLGGRRESTYTVETYDRHPGPCGNVLQKVTHIEEF
jgi:hypothetical protein